MQSQRNFLIAIVLSMVVLFGWGAIADRYFPTARPPVKTAAAPGAPAASAPGTAMAPRAAARLDTKAALAAGPRVAIRNARVAGSINLTGARVDDLVLRNHRQAITRDAGPVRLFAPVGGPRSYYAVAGWTGNGVEAPGPATVWTADRQTLAPGHPVTLRWTNGTGQTFILRYAIDDAYMLTVDQRIENNGAAPVAVRPIAFITREGKSPDVSTWNAHVGPMGVFNGTADYGIDWETLDEAGTAGRRFTTPGGWLGFTDHYWLSALIPPANASVDAGFLGEGGTYQADFAAAPVIVPAGAANATQTRIFAGAKELNVLDRYEGAGVPMLGKAIDWGWYEIIEKPILRYLIWLFQLVGNFGVAIILLTLTVRILLIPIANKQFASMAAMKGVQPKLKALQERYKDDKPKLQQEMMELYKAEKINPLAGCMPLLLQIPIFFALYKVLILSTEMRHQPFVGWIRDLSAPDPLTPVNLFGLLPFTPPSFLAIGVLAIILGVTQWAQMKLNPQPTDEVQAQMFRIMPWLMMVIMAPFAAGLLVYYIATNIFTMAQQKLLYMRHPALAPDPKTA